MVAIVPGASVLLTSKFVPRTDVWAEIVTIGQLMASRVTP